MNFNNNTKHSPAGATHLDWEEKIGIRVFVWIGAIALALAGIFLVKYSMDRGWIGPPVRIALGITFGIVFIGAGEWMRSRSSRIAQGFSAAGIAVLYACFLAAHHLYHLIGAPGTLFFLILTTSTAVLLSLNQGPITAFLGLLGGLFTPIWIPFSRTEMPMLFSYLFLLQTGLLIVAGRRKSLMLAWMALAGVNLWTFSRVVAFASLLSSGPAGDSLILGPFLALTLYSFSVFIKSGSKEWCSGTSGEMLIWSCAITVLLQFAILINLDSHASFHWLVLGLISTAFMIMGRKDKTCLQICLFLSLVVPILLIQRSVTGNAPLLPILLGMGLLFAAGGYLSMWGPDKALTYAVLSVYTSICFFLIAYANGYSHNSLWWSANAILCGAVYVAAIIPVIRKREAFKEGNRILAALAVGATAFLSFSIPIQLEKEWLTVAWALEVPLLLLVSSKLKVSQLRNIAVALAVFVMTRLMAPSHSSITWYWLLYVYGICLLSFWFSEHHLERNHQDGLATAFRWLFVATASLLCSFEVRVFYHEGRIWTPSFSVAECGVISSVWIALAILFRKFADPDSDPTFISASQVMVLAAVFQSAVAQVLFWNPLWNRIPVGEIRILNELLLGYGLPAFICAFLAYRTRKEKSDFCASLGATASVILSFFLVTLEIRHFFHGTYLNGRLTGLAEGSAYSIAWLLYGWVLLEISKRSSLRIFNFGGKAALLLAMWQIIHGPLLNDNPLWSHYSVGQFPVWNLLVPMYALPAVLMFFVSARRKDLEPNLFILMQILGFLLMFTFVNLEIRQFFHGAYLDEVGDSALEKYTYSIAWLLFSLALVGVGIRTRELLIRYCSVGFTLATAGKVFLYDTKHLTDLFRVFSFLGLGLSLFLVAYLYQKFLRQCNRQYE